MHTDMQHFLLQSDFVYGVNNVLMKPGQMALIGHGMHIVY